MTQIKIRTATIMDARTIASIRAITWRATYAGIIPAQHLAALDVDADTRRYQEGLADLPVERIAEVAEAVLPGDPPEVIGYCMSGPERSGDKIYTGEVYAIYVLPQFHSQGVGRALFQSALRGLKERGHQAAVVYVLEENLPARRFYEAMGGSPAREQIIELGGAALPELGYGYTL